MKSKIITLLFAIFMPLMAFADESATTQNDITHGDDFIPYSELQKRDPDDTPCATAVLENALAVNAATISEYDDEHAVREWIRETFAHRDVLTALLQCPEISSIDETQTVVFQPIKFTFVDGREITINYETQPRVFRQRLALINRASLPAATPNPDIESDEVLWVNVDPAWYGIMITRHGALDNFVGPDKNNTLSLDYIRDNIQDLYPDAWVNASKTCVGGSALTRDNLPLNRLIREKTSGFENDKNDYYVADTTNLEWIGYAEMAIDVVLAIASWGGSAALQGFFKSIRGVQAVHDLRNTMRTLEKSSDVVKYINKTKELKRLKALNRVDDATEIATLEKDIKNLEKIGDVKKYKNAATKMDDVLKYTRELYAVRRLGRVKQTGNMVSRAWKTGKTIRRTYKATKKGTKILDKGARVARRSMKSGRIRDKLFHSSLTVAGGLANAVGNVGGLVATLDFVGHMMWDITESSTSDYTNGIEFAPLLLLSADELEGQENEVNFGMWLLWQGSSTSPTDDDAAFLQAMDFAERLHFDLMNEQGGKPTPCNIDIWVVRPVIRDPNSDNPELYYLIMNDVPWTTNE